MVPAGSQVTASCQAPRFNYDMLQTARLMMPSDVPFITPTKPKKDPQPWSPEKPEGAPRDAKEAEKPKVGPLSSLEEAAPVPVVHDISSEEEMPWDGDGPSPRCAIRELPPSDEEASSSDADPLEQQEIIARATSRLEAILKSLPQQPFKHQGEGPPLDRSAGASGTDPGLLHVRATQYPSPGPDMQNWLEDLRVRLPSLPGFRGVPNRLLSRLLPSSDTPAVEFPQAKILLALYAGADDDTSTKSAMCQLDRTTAQRFLEMDTCRAEPYMDVLDDCTFLGLVHLARAGYIEAVLGGPMCRTWSIRRWFPRQGFPGPVRGRHKDECWGWDPIHRRPLSKEQQQEVDDDSLLILRLLLLFVVSRTEGWVTAFLMEHPADPATCSLQESHQQCASWWNTQQCKEATLAYELQCLTGAQGPLGHVVEKLTTLWTNLPIVGFHGLTDDMPRKPYRGSSSDLSRWAWGLNILICQALLKFLRSTGKEPQQVSEANTLRLEVPANPATDMVQLGHRSRPLRDGGGKPSMGRMPLEQRPEGKLHLLGRLLSDCVQEWRLKERFATYHRQPQHERSKQGPFEEEEFQQLAASTRGRIAAIIPEEFWESGHFKDTETQPGQPFALYLLAAIAKLAGDPDWRYPLEVLDGVPLGVDEDVLDDPGVWPTKEELGQEPMELEPCAPCSAENYSSALRFSEEVDNTFLEEVPLGMVEGPLSEQMAAERCQCSVTEMAVGALAAIDEGSKVRTIFDASITNVNDRIRARMRKKTTAPGLHDLLWARKRLKRRTPNKVRLTLFKTDARKAHRRIKVKRKDWKYMVAKTGSQDEPTSWKFWINKVGTYGVASAQWYWGRMAALINRLTYHLDEAFLYVFVFVDDYILVLVEITGDHWSTVFLLFLIVIGCPVSWHKNELAPQNLWVGYEVDINTGQAGLPPDKEEPLRGALARFGAKEKVKIPEVSTHVGKLAWVAKAYPPIMPFLQPLYAWNEKIKHLNPKQAVVPGELAQFVNVMIDKILDMPRQPIFPEMDALPIFGATDASAKHSAQVSKAGVGGWYSTNQNPNKEEVRWFYLDITKDLFPWVYEKCNPQLRIAALELFGTILLSRAIARDELENAEVARARPVTMHLNTDNKGNAYSLQKDYARKWPSSAMLMEHTLWCYLAKIFPEVVHVKRENNQWADALADGKTEGFSPAKKILIPEERWLVWEELLRVASKKNC